MGEWLFKRKWKKKKEKKKKKKKKKKKWRDVAFRQKCGRFSNAKLLVQHVQGSEAYSSRGSCNGSLSFHDSVCTPACNQGRNINNIDYREARTNKNLFRGNCE